MAFVEMTFNLRCDRMFSESKACVIPVMQAQISEIHENTETNAKGLLQQVNSRIVLIALSLV